MQHCFVVCWLQKKRLCNEPKNFKLFQIRYLGMTDRTDKENIWKKFSSRCLHKYVHIPRLITHELKKIVKETSVFNFILFLKKRVCSYFFPIFFEANVFGFCCLFYFKIFQYFYEFLNKKIKTQNMASSSK